MLQGQHRRVGRANVAGQRADGGGQGPGHPAAAAVAADCDLPSTPGPGPRTRPKIPDRPRPEAKLPPNRPRIDPGSTPSLPRIDHGSAADRPRIDPGSTPWMAAGSTLDRPPFGPRSASNWSSIGPGWASSWPETNCFGRCSPRRAQTRPMSGEFGRCWHEFGRGACKAHLRRHRRPRSSRGASGISNFGRMQSGQSMFLEEAHLLNKVTANRSSGERAIPHVFRTWTGLRLFRLGIFPASRTVECWIFGDHEARECSSESRPGAPSRLGQRLVEICASGPPQSRRCSEKPRAPRIRKGSSGKVLRKKCRCLNSGFVA